MTKVLCAAAAVLSIACSQFCMDISSKDRQGGAFAIPKEIRVDLRPFSSLEEALAHGPLIDWQKDAEKARAAQLAYAAEELRSHLAAAGVQVAVAAVTQSLATKSFVLATREQVGSGTTTELRDLTQKIVAFGPEAHAAQYTETQSIWIVGNSSLGVLYGVYKFLAELGFAWHDPTETMLPQTTALTAVRLWPSFMQDRVVDFRGSWIYKKDPVSEDYAIWLARNRFNLGGIAPPSLKAKLGLKNWAGAHELLQEEFSAVGLFERHPEWFALVNGVRRPIPPTGQYFNPAFANADAARFFAQRLVERLRSGDLQDIDMLNLWPVDDRFNQFDQSPLARSLGNETDNLLYFSSVVANELQTAYSQGRLNRLVYIAGISYFLTMEPPSNRSVVETLEKTTNYLHLFYPIQRSWAGPLDSNLATRDFNREFLAAAEQWRKRAKLRYGFVDYHNLSSLGGIAVTDAANYEKNFSLLVGNSAAVYGYMHPLLSNPGPRRLTNMLMATLAWQDPTLDRNSSAREISYRLTTERYFEARYGSFAPQWARLYEDLARSVENATELFGHNSLEWLILQRIFWSSPFYTDAEVIEFFDRFLEGGQQELPAKLSLRSQLSSQFIGMNDSLRLQEDVLLKARELVDRPAAGLYKPRMQADIKWFEATLARYQLLRATMDYQRARHAGLSTEAAREKMLRQLSVLEESSATLDTISPVNQRAAISRYRSLIQ